MRWKLRRVSYVVSKFHELWFTVHKQLKIGPEFFPPYVISALHKLTSLSGHTRKSANGTPPKLCQTAASKSLTVCRRKVVVVPPKNRGQKCIFGFSSNLRLNGEYLLNKTWPRQSGKDLGSTRGPLHRPKFRKRWSTNGLKLDWSFYPPSVSLFCSVPSPSHTPCGISVALRHWLCLQWAQIRSPKIS